MNLFTDIHCWCLVKCDIRGQSDSWSDRASELALLGMIDVCVHVYVFSCFVIFFENYMNAHLLKDSLGKLVPECLDSGFYWS